jgi:hypothetical protein
MESENVLQVELSLDSLASPRSASSNSVSSWLSNEKRRRQQYMTDVFNNVGAITVVTGTLVLHIF